MFPSPPKTLNHSLSNVLTGAQKYNGDVRFVFGNEQQLWAHKALLIARVPKACVLKMMPQLLDDKNTNNTLITISDLANWIPYPVFVNLLRFWYTASFVFSKTMSSSPTPSIVSSLSSSSITTSSSSSSPTELVSPVATCAETSSAIHQSIIALEQKLQLQLLPQTTEGLSNDEQLVIDLACMRRNQLNCDITINIFKSDTSTTNLKKNKSKKQAPKPLSTPPTLVKRHTTPAKITTTSSAKSDNIVSILNTRPITPPTNDDEDDTETSSCTTETSSSSPTMISFPVHRCVLASRSSYFHSLLYDQQTSNTPCSSIVLLPSHLFSSMTLDIILHYFYTDQLQVPDLSSDQTTATSSTMSVFQKEMNRKKHRLRELQKVFCAAGYLGLAGSLCKTILHDMESICHRFQCMCSSCVVLLPSMVAFANKQQHLLPLLRSCLLTLYADPIQAFPPLWSQKPFSLLVMAHLVCTEDGGRGGNNNNNSNLVSIVLPSSLQCLFHNSSNNYTSDSNTPTSPWSSSSLSPTLGPSPSSPSSSPSSLLVDLISMTLENITKRNAIHVLHSIHLCLSKIRSADPLPTWSQPSLSLIHAFLHHTLAMVSLDFNYYCVDYPILLSCVDGIGGGFSVDFLDFLLKRLLNSGIQDSNAAVIYQGIVRDLIGRQQVVNNVAVDGVLLDARRQCVEYLTHRWIGVKAAQGGFQSIDKDVLRMMAEDINVPYRTLSKTIESEMSTMFGFKSKTLAVTTGRQRKFLESTETVTEAAESEVKHMASPVASGTGSTLDIIAPSSKSRRRLSLNTLRHPRLSTSRKNRHRRSAAEVGEWMDSSFDDQRSLSDNEMNSSTTATTTTALTPTQHSFHRHLSLQQQTATHHHPTLTRSSSISSWTDVLLPVDVSTSSLSSPLATSSSPEYHQHHQRMNTTTTYDDGTIIATTTTASTSTPLTGKPPPRKSRLTFELPETPIRTQLSIKCSNSNNHHHHHHHHGKSTSRHKYRWGGLKSGSKDSGSDSADDDDDQHQLVVASVGAKVELLHRPLPTLGRIKYIGHVEFSRGTWVGVELESRLGQNDGSVDGVRYFQTDPQRGVFVKSDGLKLISGPLKP